MLMISILISAAYSHRARIFYYLFTYIPVFDINDKPYRKKKSVKLAAKIKLRTAECLPYDPIQDTEMRFLPKETSR